MFGFDHGLEAYVPKHKRVHGYYTMPLLAGGRLVGRVDPAREGSTLVARKVSLDRATAAEPMAQALREAAAWVGCDDVRLEQIEPAQHASRLAAALTPGNLTPSRQAVRSARVSGPRCVRTPGPRGHDLVAGAWTCARGETWLVRDKALLVPIVQNVRRPRR